MSEIAVGTRVQLTDGPVAGWTGIVRDLKKDADEALVEWDHGEAWTWTMKSRLKPTSSAENIVSDAMRRREEEKCPTCGHDNTDAIDERIEGYMRAVEEAVTATRDSDGFVLITVSKVPHPDNPKTTMYIPDIFAATTDNKTVDVMEAQIALMAAEHHQRLIVKQLKRRMEEE